MNISEIKSAVNGIPIVEPGLRALVAKVGERKTGNGNYGEWSLQPIELKDTTGSINATIWNRDDLQPLLGREIHLQALHNGKGWAGCIVEDREYTAKDGTKKIARQIKASGVFILEGTAKAQPAPQNSSGTDAETIQKSQQGSGLPNWSKYTAVARSAHYLANELEPDINGPTDIIDRSRARAAIMATILIAYGKHDFSFEVPANQDLDDIPF